MKIRRHTGSGFSLRKFLKRFKPDDWFGRAIQEADSTSTPEDVAVTESDVNPSNEPSATGGRRFMSREGLRTFWQSPWVFPTSFLGFVIVGYLVAAVALFPAPIFTSNITVPNLLGMSRDEAETALTDAGLNVVTPELKSHPTAPRGSIVWQEPPADVSVPEATRVQIWVSAGPQQVPIPDVAGYEERLARLLVERAGLSVGRVQRIQTAQPRDVAVNTRPGAGTIIAPGGEVTLVISAGVPSIPIPDVAGLTPEDAQARLEEAGLTFGQIERRTTRAQPSGFVFATDPPIGTLTAEGTTINVRVAR